MNKLLYSYSKGLRYSPQQCLSSEKTNLEHCARAKCTYGDSLILALVDTSPIGSMVAWRKNGENRRRVDYAMKSRTVRCGVLDNIDAVCII
jgi:hypothetical protein